MTLPELVIALKATGYPVAYSHFDVDDENPHPKPPYLIYLGAGNDDLIADNRNYVDISNIQVELYTNKKDLPAETALQNKFKELHLPYRKYPDVWIDSEKVFQIIYEIQLIGA